MDTLRSATAIFATLETALKVIKYVRAVAGANAARQKLLQELAQVRGLLLTLRDLFEDTTSEVWSTALKDTNSPMAMFQALVDEMQHRIEQQDSPTLPDSTPTHESSERSFSNQTKQKMLSLATHLKGVKWPYDESKLKEHLDTLERIKSAILLALSNDSIQLSKLIRNELADMHGDVRDVAVGMESLASSLENVSKITTTTNRQTNELLLHARGDEIWTEERERLFKSISTLDLSFRPGYISFDDIQRYSTRFLSHTTFLEWLTNGGSLMLIGPSGSGKGAICRAVESLLRTSDESCVVVVDFNKPNINIPDIQGIFANIVKRMIEEKRSFQKYYNRLMLTGIGPLELNDSLRIIHRARQDFQHFYLILEGLNTCTDSAMRDLLSILGQMRTPLTIFATSCSGRFTNDFSYTIDIGSFVEVNNDLKLFIQRRLEESSNPFWDSIDADEIAAITDRAFELSEGLFLRANIIVEYLCSATTREEADTILTNVPSLADIIERMFLSIADQDLPKARLGYALVQFLAQHDGKYSTSELLRDAQETEPGLLESAGDADQKLEVCIDCCGGLVLREDDSIIFTLSAVRDWVRKRYQEVATEKE